MLDNNIKSVLIIGMGRSGIASARLLKKLNKKVYIYDSNKKEKISMDVQKMALEVDGAFFGMEPIAMIENKEIDLVVISPGVPLNIDIVDMVKSHNIPIIGELELGYLYAKGRVVAITGTNGKTTTTSLVAHICECEKLNHILVGNIGIPITQKVLDNIIAGDNNEYLWVAEVSSFQLETINTFKPVVAAILNITPDHLNRHGSMEEYIKAKLRVYENQSHEDVLVINSEDSVLMDAISSGDEGAAVPKKVYFGTQLDEKNGVCIDDECICLNDGTCVLPCDELRIIGKHNIQNAMAAVAICHSIGISIDAIREGLKTFHAVEHRLQKIAEHNLVEFYNDSKATNPDAAIKALESIDKPIILIAGGMDKKNDFTELVGWVKKKVKSMVVFGETADILKNTALKEQYHDVFVVGNMSEAVDKAFCLSASGDVVLLSPACASWDMYKNYEVRGNDFISCVKQKIGEE